MAAEAEVERLIVRLIGDGTSFQNMLATANASSKRTVGVLQSVGAAVTALKVRLLALGATFRKVGAGMRRIGRTLSTFVTAPLLIMAGVSVFAFSNFDKAMTESTSIMQVTTRQIEEMRDAAINLSAGGELLQGPKELAESYFFLASAGKNAEQAIALLPKVSAFATAGAFDMALATDLLTDAQSALGLTMEDTAADARQLARVGDVLVKANTLANASVQQFATALTSKAGAAIKSFGKDVEEGVAVLAAFADQGVKAELAGNALDRILRLSVKSALDNAAAHKRLGFNVFDASGEMRNMADIVGNLEDILGGLSTKQKAATLDMLGFEARVQGVILPLIGTSNAIREYEKQLRKAGGITQEVADKQMKSFANQMKVMKNQLTVVAIEIGEVLAPILLRLNKVFKIVVEAWRSLSPVTKQAIVIIGLAVAAIGPVLSVLGVLTIGLGFVITAVGTIIGAWPILLGLLAGTVAVVGGLTATWMIFGDTIKSIFQAVFPTVRDFFVKAIGFVFNLRENFKLFMDWFGRNWKNLLVDAGKIVKNLVDNAGFNFGVLVGLGIKLFKRLGKQIADWLGFGFKAALPILRSMLVSAGTLVAAWGAEVANLVTDALSGKLFKGGAKGFIRGLKTVLAVPEEAAKPAAKTYAGLIERELGKLKITEGIDFSTEALPDAITDLPDLFGGKGKLKDDMAEAVEGAVAAVAAKEIPPVRVPVQLTTVEAIDVGSIEDLLLLSKIPTLQVPRAQIPRPEPNAARLIRRERAVQATAEARTPGLGGVTAVRSAAAAGQDFGKTAATGVTQMVGLLQQSLELQIQQLEEAKKLEIESSPFGT